MVERLADLRGRARRLGFTVQSDRGTATGWYHLKAQANDGSGRVLGITCQGLDALEREITAFTDALPGLTGRPSFDTLNAAELTVHQQKQRAYEERERARPILNCAYCNEPKDGDHAYRVGPEDVPPDQGYMWVHARCLEPFRERNRRQLEAMGFVNGVKIVSRAGGSPG